jgi:hypothetical protein
MKRIGIAASKIANENVALYNFYVVLIAFIFSLFLFLVSGAAVLFSLYLIGFLAEKTGTFNFAQSERTIFTVCMSSLTILVGLFNIMAILKNIQIPHHDK